MEVVLDPIQDKPIGIEAWILSDLSDLTFVEALEELGGPRSGHHGHKGIPGSQGGSIASNIGNVLHKAGGWSEVDPRRQKDLVKVGEAIPGEHLVGINTIVFDGDRVDEYERRYEYSNVGGYYDPESGSIILRPDRVTGSMLAHEVGHHVFDQHTEQHKVITPEYDRVKSMSKSELWQVGLRGHSQTNPGEYWADSYSLLVGARAKDKYAVKWAKEFRKQLPETTRVMKSILRK